MTQLEQQLKQVRDDLRGLKRYLCDAIRNLFLKKTIKAVFFRNDKVFYRITRTSRVSSKASYAVYKGFKHLFTFSGECGYPSITKGVKVSDLLALSQIIVKEEFVEERKYEKR